MHRTTLVSGASRTTGLRRALATSAVLALFMALGGNALGQASGPGSQPTDIKAFVEKELEALKGSNPVECEKARDALLERLAGPDVPVAARFEYAKLLLPELKTLAASTDDHTAVNALRIAGKLQTSGALEPISKALADQRPQVRVGAARAAKDTLRTFAIATKPTPLPAKDAESLVDKLADGLAVEKDPVAAMSMVVALDAARAGSAGGAAGALHARAMEKLGDAIAARVKLVRAQKLSDDDASAWNGVVASAIEAIRRTIIDTNRGALNDKPELRKAAARANGQAVAYCRDRIAASTKNAGALKPLVGAADQVLNLLAGTKSETLSAALKTAEAGDAAAFGAAADKWIGASGALCKPPFSLDAKDFAPAAGK